MSGDSQLREIIARIRKVGGLVEQAAPQVAATLRGKLEEQISAGVDPGGNAWQPTQAGEQPLEHAGSALAVTHRGTTVFARLRGPEARHNNGTARGHIVRRILPTKGFAKGVADAIRDVLTREYRESGGP